MGNFIDIAAKMQQAGAAEQVAGEDELLAALRTRLADPGRVRAEGEKARIFASAEDGVLAAVIAAISAWLPQTKGA
jgi:3-deoxy-D-manno-octulosonic-acid transferase